MARLSPLSYCILRYFYYFCDVEYPAIYKNFNIAMKKLFSLVFTAVMMLAVSCELLQTESPTPQGPEVPSQNDPKITLTSESSIEVPADGGVYTITYTTEGEASIIATTDNPQMVDAINTNLTGYVRINVSENTVAQSREANVIITYGSSSASVKLTQAAAEAPELKVVNIAANQLVGNYYGERLADGVGHYWIILTKDGFVNGATVAGGEYFRLDIVAPLAESDENITLPDGDYRLDLSLSYEPYTIIDIENTDYTWVDENMEGWAMRFVDASLSVRGNHLELVARTEDTEFHVSYEGSYSLTPPYVITDYVSSLKSDTVIDVSNCTASYGGFGDYWECGCNNWNIEFVCNDGLYQGTYVVIDFLSSSATDFTGTYVSSGFSKEDPTKPDFRAGTFIPGIRISSVSDLLMGSLYMVYKDGLCVSQAPLFDGTITITNNGGNVYTIVINAYDDAPKQNKITLNWTGYLN